MAPPLSGWIKCNTDGVFGMAACGGLFRSYRGFVCGSFVQHIETATAFYAEFFALIIAVEMAYQERLAGVV